MQTPGNLVVVEAVSVVAEIVDYFGKCHITKESQNVLIIKFHFCLNKFYLPYNYLQENRFQQVFIMLQSRK